ncbi:putative phosphoglycerate mutase family member 5 [Trypanosoma cruzi]|uniref:Serine/threonine-protein phosphatase PGAM5, mitochondrial n=1 Tax=Trypanosoma cruzi (strain CL Brener) TaxID=353153 RepID=Q4DDQ7_TRYCC|nr:phosphoglycerate mutase-like protein, putative [Trypanosoma cruzi]EAN90648.1 phosphoglycerate mutase-like protein, putative [Trypanosoma cruzi]KAF8275285.1 putative phosphoglycerate mutase family member 5 [Trypanosoma cruzi]|eukprot:XP_812499.1 phosphoglycerate mutase-like protein [Trypanosoma cruzi strain CL Brener]
MLVKVFFGGVVGVFFSSFSSCWCEGPSQRGISPDGLRNYTLESLPPPTKEELEYVKTWGVPWVSDWDRPGVRGIRADRHRSFQRQIILIRHGQYQNESSNDDRVRTLTSLGEEQARRTGEYLWKAFVQSGNKMVRAKNYAADYLASDASSSGGVAGAALGENHMGGFLIATEPKFIHVSDMTRAQQTAKLILEAFPSHVRRRLATDAALRERFPCDPEPVFRNKYASYKDMRAVEGVFEKYFHRSTADESSVEIIVGHANVIRYLVCRALQLPPEAWLRISLSHCSITSIIISGNGHVRLSCLGSAGHLPVDQITTRNVS